MKKCLIDDRRFVNYRFSGLVQPLYWLLSPTLSRCRPWFDRVFTLAFGPGSDKHTSLMSRDYMLKLYRSHNAHVKQNCDPNRLLVFHLRDGWKPICKLLGEVVPDKEFPHSNKKGSIVDDLMNSQAPHSARKQIEREFFRNLSVYVVLGGVYWFYKDFVNNFIQNSVIEKLKF